MQRTFGLILTLFAAHALLAPDVRAEKRRNPLEGQPAVRHRYVLRSGRFEIGPSFMFSINRSYQNAFVIGAKLEYHINDFLSVGADVGFGINFATQLLGEIENTYITERKTQEFVKKKQALSRMTVPGDVRLTFTPFAGKLGIFSALFMAYDMYVFGGFGFGLITNDTDNARVDATNDGFRPGAAWGAGVHFFFNDFISLGIEFKDLIFNDNQSGADQTRGLTQAEVKAGQVLLDGDDQAFQNHFFAGINVTFFLPATAEISP